LFRKIIKGFKEQKNTLIDYNYKIQSLEVQLKKARLRKRIKIRTSSNSKFINIIKIKRTQLAAREVISKEKDKEEANKSDSTLDYILIE
jgi:hypothetical protein